MIREITVLSGKGGTGKTSVTAALAYVAKNAVFSDCDVDAADLHLLLQPDVQEQHAFDSGSKAVIDTGKCISCGICEQECRFDAIRQIEAEIFVVDPFKCEGCRLCERICPTKAISSVSNMNNYWYVSQTRFGPMVHARMAPGEENSGKLVTTVRKKAREIAATGGYGYIINDGPPGIGCPVIASLTGVQHVLLVVEPSKTGIHDILRIEELTRKFQIPAYAIINKQDLNPCMSQKAENILQDLNIPVLGKLNYDPGFVKAMIRGQTINEYAPRSFAATTIATVWSKLSKHMMP
jgi:MinD superfamily P-loop ATPase